MAKDQDNKAASKALQGLSREQIEKVFSDVMLAQSKERPKGPESFQELMTGLSFAPGIGDAAGLIADALMFKNEPKSRTLGNAALSGLGVLPFVPPLSVTRVGKELAEKQIASLRKNKTARDDVADTARRISGFDNPVPKQARHSIERKFFSNKGMFEVSPGELRKFNSPDAAFREWESLTAEAKKLNTQYERDLERIFKTGNATFDDLAQALFSPEQLKK